MRVANVLPLVPVKKGLSKISNKAHVTKPENKISEELAKKMLSTSAAAISSLFVVKKSLEQNRNTNVKPENSVEILRNLKLNDKTINKILSIKKTDGEYLFDEQKVKILQSAESLYDKSFFNFIMKNLDGLTNLGVGLDPETNNPSYFMSSKSKNGESCAILSIDTVTSEINIGFSEQKGNTKTITSRLNKRGLNVVEEITKYVNSKNVLHEVVEYDNINNSITRTKYNPETKSSELSKKMSFSKEGVIDGLTETKFDYSQKDILSKSIHKDFKHGTLINNTGGEFGNDMISQTRVYKNPITGKTETIKMELSDVPGAYNSTIIDEKGHKHVESFAKKKSDGSIYVEKNLKSLDGTVTHQKYSVSSDGKRIKNFYQIVDANGKAISTTDRTFTKIDENHTQSSINGHKYSMEKINSDLFVTDHFSGKTTKIALSDISNDFSKSSELFEQMSGDMILDMYNRKYKVKYTEDPLDSYAHTLNRIINTGKDLYIFAHEQGHSKDVTYPEMPKNINILTLMELLSTPPKFLVSEDKEFLDAYTKERNAFVKTFSNLEQDYIEYFINLKNHIGGQNGAKMETVAETNAILSTSAGHNILAAREYYLQKFFPKTIAVLSRKLNPHSNVAVENK